MNEAIERAIDLVERARENTRTIIKRREQETGAKLEDSLGTFLPAIFADLDGALAILMKPTDDAP